MEPCLSQTSGSKPFVSGSQQTPPPPRRGEFHFSLDLFRDLSRKLSMLGILFETPTVHIQVKNMNKHMAHKLPNLPCFEAFGAIFCPNVCSYFCFRICLVLGMRHAMIEVEPFPVSGTYQAS